MAIIYYEDLKSRRVIKDKFKNNCKKLNSGLYYVNEEKYKDKSELIKFSEENLLSIYFKGDKQWTNFMSEEPPFSISSNLMEDILISNNYLY
jgi:hypothetical protein